MTSRTPRQTEPSANTALADLLREMLSDCRIRAEHTRLIAGRFGLQLDLLVTAPDRAPVAVEAEYLPAHTVEPEATARLGLRVVDEPNPIEAAIALRYPRDVGDADDLRAAITEAELSYCVFTQERQGTTHPAASAAPLQGGEKPVDSTASPSPPRRGGPKGRGGLPTASHAGEGSQRFPTTGWLTGSVADLADLIRLVSVPQHAVDAAATALEEGIDHAVTILHDMAAQRPAITPNIARLLGMSDVYQTRRMACAIVANALIFHERLTGMYAEVKPLHLVCGPSTTNPQDNILSAWSRILDINYWAIFAIARDIVAQLPPREAARILAALRETAQDITTKGVTNAHDLTGRLFQRLIADRKYLATFYTLPASASLLARLAVAKLNGVDWADADAIARLRIADFACGTGALLSAVYEQIANRHERTGGDPAQLHPAMMEEVLYGCDVMPSAIHITGSTLSGVQPNVGFGKSCLYTLAYGRQSDASVRIGSLELLQSAVSDSMFNTSDPAKRTGSVGEETATHVVADIPDHGFDLVIMNPPFTRATNHEGAHADVTNPAFAAFDATPTDQTDMGKRVNVLGKDTCYHGNAGIASAFAALAHAKLKPGGVLALVLPLSAAAGLSWQGFRQTITQRYTDVAVLSIAASGDAMSFSSDTGMAECLVVARKVETQGGSPSPRPSPSEGEGEKAASSRQQNRIQFISLNRQPQSFAHAAALAAGLMHSSEPIRQIEDGPYGGTRLTVGDELDGEIMTAPCQTDGAPWGVVRLLDYALAQTAYALARSQLWLPGAATALDLKTVSLSAVGELGLVHRDITGPPPRGPFTKVSPSPTATYPALWNHNAKRETLLICASDSSLQVRPGMESKAADVWATSSRTHLNLEYTFGSQPLAVAFTEQETIGGTVWPNVVFDDKKFEYAFAVWGNSTLGLLSYWWHSSRQQSSKARMTIRSAETLPVLDFRALSGGQLHTTEAIFDEFRDKELLPAYLADADANRALLDRRVVCDLLGFDDAVYRAVRQLAAKWCAEPSVHGGKGRPKDARLVA